MTKPVRQSYLYRRLLGLQRAEPRVPDPRPLTEPSAVVTDQPSHRILVVEDNLVNQKVAVRHLERLGYGADVASNGQEALAALERTHYDLVLMDIQMPGMDGFEATARIREREQAGKRLPIIAMTANALEGERERCLEGGMDDYIAKPFKQEVLAQTLARWLTHHAPVPPAFPARRDAGTKPA
ncbi:MAG: response regulator [Bacteroidetes bacterium]|nr:MAG: response regulator [Bacteroidota bacterium]